MLFKTRFHERIRNGSTSLTFRVWKTARVKVGNSYKFSASDFVEVESIEPVAIDSIRDDEARRAGFLGASQLTSFLLNSAPKDLTLKSKVFRVRFRYVADHADSAAALRTDISPASLDEVVGRLQRMDRRSRHGPWTRQVLELIHKNPRMAASRLAPTVNRETRPFKVDVRKLKALGLTQSFEVGYELTARGEALLKRSQLSKSKR